LRGLGVAISVAEHAAEELAGHRLGDLVDELDDARVLVGGDLRPAEDR
jgi:hypothetical protein